MIWPHARFRTEKKCLARSHAVYPAESLTSMTWAVASPFDQQMPCPRSDSDRLQSRCHRHRWRCWEPRTYISLFLLRLSSLSLSSSSESVKDEWECVCSAFPPPEWSRLLACGRWRCCGSCSLLQHLQMVSWKFICWTWRSSLSNSFSSYVVTFFFIILFFQAFLCLCS